MGVTIYNAIEKPVMTDKSAKLVRDLKKVVLNVHPQANKPLIKEALEKLFNVEVENIRIIVRKGKKRTFKRISSVGKKRKRAIVTLKPGHQLTMGESMGSEASTVEQAEVTT